MLHVRRMLPHMEGTMDKTMIAMVLAVVMVAAHDVRARSTLDDGQVFALFDEANTTDIWTARLAMAKSQSADVRRLASMVIADHEAVQHRARELAKKLGVIATPPANALLKGVLDGFEHHLTETRRVADTLGVR